MKKFYVLACAKFETPIPIDGGNLTIAGVYAPRAVAAEDREQAISAVTAILAEQLADKFPDTPNGFSARIEIHEIEEKEADFAVANEHFDFIYE